ncbi:hypothetical protein FRUB_08697 [Fimbriiglobus ruber]|uniref:Uncharacterized protein n=1 Tax=Fimbriiglobus ruber TaxID=1908690 RepID=A0A225D912_9BACT|nr:hypothetical protein FRUB_08697 [Fimbriiglobus ruber]
MRWEDDAEIINDVAAGHQVIKSSGLQVARGGIAVSHRESRDL